MTVARVFPGAVSGRVRAPPSKSYTHRALVAGFLSRRRTTVVRPLESADTQATAKGLMALGARIDFGRSNWTLYPGESRARSRTPTVRCGQSGTTLRFLLAVASCGRRRVRFVGDPELSTRPIDPLLRVLSEHGVRVARPRRGGVFPFTVQGPLTPGTMELDPSRSSQFLSALLLVLPTLAARSSIRLGQPLVSAPYVEATVSALEDSGVRVRSGLRRFDVPAPQAYRGGRIVVPGDASSAAYLWAAAAVTGGRVRVDGVPSRPPQADLAILAILRSAGARVERRGTSVTVAGRVDRPVDVDLDDAPDLLPLLSAVAAVTPGGHVLNGAAHAAFKESDRREASARLARALGARVTVSRTRLVVHGSRAPRPLDNFASFDHRMVMSAAVGALATGGRSTLRDASSVDKSYPGFWGGMRGIGMRVEVSR